MITRWDGIEEFVAVARAGSFTGGAKNLGVSTTHASRAIGRLESRLGAQLMIRSTRSLHLTDTGQIFLEQCQHIIDERDEAIATVSDQGEPRGTLRLTCSYALGEQFVAPLVRQFAQSHPTLSVKIDLDNSVVDIIERGFDLAVRTGHLEDSRLIATRIAQREMVTVASPEYIADHGEPQKVQELGSHNCLIGSTEHWSFQSVKSYQPQGYWKCNSGTAILEACTAGLGVCQLPAFYLRKQLASGDLIEVLPDEKPEDEPIWAVYPTRKHLSPNVNLLVPHLAANLQRLLNPKVEC